MNETDACAEEKKTAPTCLLSREHTTRQPSMNQETGPHQTQDLMAT
jgi:hypothetical protein